MGRQHPCITYQSIPGETPALPHPQPLSPICKRNHFSPNNLETWLSFMVYGKISVLGTLRQGDQKFGIHLNSLDIFSHL